MGTQRQRWGKGHQFSSSTRIARQSYLLFVESFSTPSSFPLSPTFLHCRSRELRSRDPDTEHERAQPVCTCLSGQEEEEERPLPSRALFAEMPYRRCSLAAARCSRWLLALLVPARVGLVTDVPHLTVMGQTNALKMRSSLQ